jgi:hypothetical protein
MTPFDSWYAAHIAPALKDAPAAAQKAAKASAAEIWNGAIDAVKDVIEPKKADELPLDHDDTICTCFLDELKSTAPYKF